MTNSRSRPSNPPTASCLAPGIELPLVTAANIGYELLLHAADGAKIALLEEMIENDFDGNAAEFSRHYDVNKGLVWKALNKGYIAPAISRAMGWPTKVEVMPCTNPDCDGFGQPHIFDCQTEQVKPKRQPAKRRPTRPRISADVTEEQRDVLKEIAASYGGWSEFCRKLADGGFWPLEPK